MAAKKRKAAAPRRVPAARDPRTGRFTKGTATNLRKIAGEISRELRKAKSTRKKFAGKLRSGAKSPKKLKDWEKQYRDAWKKESKLGKKLVDVKEKIPVRRQRLPQEIEIGIDYSADKKRTSDVNVNFRVSRKDGQGVSREDAERAILAVAYGEAGFPSDLVVKSVQWQSPWKATERRDASWRRGEGGDLFSFENIFKTVVFPGFRSGAAPVLDDFTFIEHFRMGDVKDDEL